ncbi:hypothetical protein ENUP19_0006G0012 [Entamoeba nuttalli]|uniref:HECT-type E3 ubiquitin transferase n=2 Tax=Entamoeba nuttalli TaxID=412467 RepID=K2GCC3_ENTNP|nr:ubiquitin-protein ligase, putative [Entamoeba nuttalli P19]EKE40171.1 ubiquitin-protein ligase, putative [Entamoeba nuttalli P19]|eukprot:XP_008857495.1 ubiquitin-protein ligase, putative [Entamoeba nuttalli P19]
METPQITNKKYYINRICFGCGNDQCNNKYCKSSSSFVSPLNIEEEAQQLETNKTPLCTLRCSLQRFLSLKEQTNDRLETLLYELYSTPESIIESFVEEGVFDVVKGWELIDYIFKFQPSLYQSVLSAHLKILEIVKIKPINIQSIIVTLASPIFAENDEMGEFCSTIQKLSSFIVELQVFLKKMTPKQFLCVLGNIEQFISLRVILKKNTVHDEEILFKVLTLLKTFYSINDEKRFVDENKFYNEVLATQRQFPRDIQYFYSNKSTSLLYFPFIIPVDYKMKFLHKEAKQERGQSTVQAFTESITRGEEQKLNLNIQVRRDHVLEDSLNQLVEANIVDLKKPLKVKFIGEEGLDHGGVSKEWFQLVTREIFSPNNTMFVYNDKTRICWFNAGSQQLNDYKLIGTLFGLAIYNGIILDAKLPIVVYKKILGINLQMKDLEEIQPEMFHSLEFILKYEGDDMEETMGLTFQHTQEINGEVKVIDLKPNGGYIPVTKENKKEFVQLLTDYILNTSIEKQFNAFISGFKLVFNSRLLTIFSPHELELLIAGSDTFDFHELENATRYANGYTKDTPVVKWLWEILHSYSIELKKKFLFFSTGSDRCPPGGLGRLQFIIAKHGDASRLPTSSTCNNLFLMPPYETKEELEKKLTFALNNTNGFGLI